MDISEAEGMTEDGIERVTCMVSKALLLLDHLSGNVLCKMQLKYSRVMKASSKIWSKKLENGNRKTRALKQKATKEILKEHHLFSLKRLIIWKISL